jgi:adenosylcobinamide kinase / adenosylcobinamide-phosphate guanylyltransferase
MLILVTGGSRSGKSGFALSLAEGRPGPRTFLATAQAFDDEMRERISAHRAARPAGWGLVEEPREVPAALGRALAAAPTVLVDCVTIWISNLLVADESFGETEAAAAARALVQAAGRGPGGSCAIVVTNEVGSGIVPDNALARRFRDCAGRANQIIAQAADEAWFLVSGIPVRVKPKE